MMDSGFQEFQSGCRLALNFEDVPDKKAATNELK